MRRDSYYLELPEHFRVRARLNDAQYDLWYMGLQTLRRYALEALRRGKL